MHQSPQSNLSAETKNTFVSRKGLASVWLNYIVMSGLSALAIYNNFLSQASAKDLSEKFLELIIIGILFAPNVMTIKAIKSGGKLRKTSITLSLIYCFVISLGTLLTIDKPVSMKLIGVVFASINGINAFSVLAMKKS